MKLPHPALKITFTTDKKGNFYLLETTNKFLIFPYIILKLGCIAHFLILSFMVTGMALRTKHEDKQPL